MSDWQKLKREILKKPEYAGEYASTPSLDLALLIVNARKSRHLTQQQLAELSGTRQPAISRLESGDYESCSIKTLSTIARVLKKSLKISFADFSPQEDTPRAGETHAKKRKAA